MTLKKILRVDSIFPRLFRYPHHLNNNFPAWRPTFILAPALFCFLAPINQLFCVAANQLSLSNILNCALQF